MFKQSCTAYKSDFIRICRPLFCFIGGALSAHTTIKVHKIIAYIAISLYNNPKLRA